MMFLTDSQVAKRYSVHRCTVWRWMREGLFPKTHQNYRLVPLEVV